MFSPKRKRSSKSSEIERTPSERSERERRIKQPVDDRHRFELGFKDDPHTRLDRERRRAVAHGREREPVGELALLDEAEQGAFGLLPRDQGGTVVAVSVTL